MLTVAFQAMKEGITKFWCAKISYIIQNVDGLKMTSQSIMTKILIRHFKALYGSPIASGY